MVNRHPAGTSAGGQFAPGSASEIDTELGEQPEFNVGQPVRIGDTWLMRTKKGLIAAHRDAGGLITTVYVDDDRAQTQAPTNETAEALNQLPQLRRVGSPSYIPGEPDFGDAEDMAEHLEAGMLAEASDDTFSWLNSCGHWRLDGSHGQLGAAAHFIDHYRADRQMLDRVRPLSDEERAQLLETLKHDEDPEAAEEAADILGQDNQLYRCGFDPSRPPLMPYDRRSPASQEAVKIAEDDEHADPETVFAYTTDGQGQISEVFYVTEQGGRSYVSSARGPAAPEVASR